MRMAIIDLGTNTFNLLIVEISEREEIEYLFKTKAGVKLGRGGIHKKEILPDAFERGLHAIQSYYNRIDEYGVEKIIATATSGVRSAKNGDKFINQLKTDFDLDVKVISGDKEAELIYKGVRKAINLGNENVLILDIGGGSNEFIVADNRGIQWKKSYDLGMARLLEKFNPSDPITEDEIAKVQKCLTAELKELSRIISHYKPVKFIGCSGTFDTFRSLLEAESGKHTDQKRANSVFIDHKKFEKLYKKLIDSTLEERLAMKGMEVVRVEMIVLAAIFVNFCMRNFGFEDLYQSDYAIKEGVLFDYLDK